MKRVLLTIAAAFVLAIGAQAAEIYYNLGDGVADYGTGRSTKETYDVAMRITDPALVGQKVKGVRIYFPTVEGVTEAKAWLSKEIGVKSSKFTGADVQTVSFEAAEGFNEVSFTAYTITSAGIYVGYSFETAGVSGGIRPIRLTDSSTPDGFYLHTSGQYRSSFKSSFGQRNDLAIEVLLDGDFTANAATATAIPDIKAKTNTENGITFDLINQGTAGVQSIDYVVEVAGLSEEHHLDLASPIAGFYGRRQTVSVAVPVVAEQGSYRLKVDVKQVNGATNGGTITAGEGQADFYNTLPIKRPVCDEYTGLWCGWCPRGFVGMQLMAEKYGEDFVGLCFHNGDQMEIMSSSQFPMSISGFPSGDVDRVAVIDPKFTDFESNWLARREIFAPLAVDVETKLDGDNFAVTALVTSPIDLDNDRYQLAFAVTHNGMTDASWGQSNYYAGVNSYKDGYMDWFCDQGSTVYGLEFDDVIIAWTGKGSIAGSLPEHFEGDVAVSYTHTFDLTKAVNTSGANLVQDPAKLKGVVMVIDTKTGQVTNANQAYSNQGTTDVKGLATSKDDIVRSVVYYNMQGRQVLHPQNGMFIKAETLQSGKVRTRKVVL